MTQQTQPTMSTIRVLVVDDQRLMRDGIASLLGLQPGINVIGTAANGQEALDQAQALQPDVILMDVRMPLMDGVAATFAVRQALPACQILMLTTFDDEAYVIDALRAGACGYLLKDMPASDLAQAIQAAHRGIYQLDPAVASKVVASLAAANRAGAMASPPAPDSATNPAMLPRPQSELTGRELEVLRLIATGATNREIADTLVISEGTVKNHISNILSRLQLRDRTQAAVYAREAGLL
jgi:DNA-binding NarL/FixJ family response regulator